MTGDRSHSARRQAKAEARMFQAHRKAMLAAGIDPGTGTRVSPDPVVPSVPLDDAPAAPTPTPTPTTASPGWPAGAGVDDLSTPAETLPAAAPESRQALQSGPELDDDPWAAAAAAAAAPARLRAAAAWGALAALGVFSAASGLPVNGRSGSWGFVIGGALLAAAGLLRGRHLAAGSRGWRAPAAWAAPALAVAVMFAVGVPATVVVAGQVQLSTSQSAQAYSLASEVVGRFADLQQVDTLLGLDPAQARSEILRLEAEEQHMRDLQEWAKRTAAAPLPAESFRVVLVHVQQAAFFAEQALGKVRDNVLQPDERAVSDAQTLRGSFQQEALDAAQGLAELAGLFGFTLTIPEPEVTP